LDQDVFKGCDPERLASRLAMARARQFKRDNDNFPPLLA
jgi:hypothetical protein